MEQGSVFAVDSEPYGVGHEEQVVFSGAADAGRLPSDECCYWKADWRHKRLEDIQY